MSKISSSLDNIRDIKEDNENNNEFEHMKPFNIKDEVKKIKKDIKHIKKSLDLITSVLLNHKSVIESRYSESCEKEKYGNH